MPIPLPLHTLPLGCPARVVSIQAAPELRHRLRELGLIHGAPVVALYKNISGDPVAYAIRGATIALRNCDAANVLVTVDGEVRI